MPVFVTDSVEQTEALGTRFARELQAGDVVALFGELGTGKTAFTRGVCRGLGIEDVVSSPTFTLINEYEGQLPVYHFDFYRISKPDELLELGCDEYFQADGVCLIEWPERIADELPASRREVYLRNLFAEKHENAREIRIVEREGSGN